MIINSQFRDYYDNIKSFGIDRTIVFNRDTKETIIDEQLPYYDTFEFRKYMYESYACLIGFCGKVYPVIKIRRRSTVQPSEDVVFCYTPQDVDSFLTKYEIKERAGWSFFGRTLHIRDPKEVKEFFELNNYNHLTKLFGELNVPTFVLKHINNRTSKTQLVTNPKLADYDFVRAVSMPSAFQEIMSYISGVLGQSAKPMIKITDKELAKKRGHGDPYSFRKPPKGKKK